MREVENHWARLSGYWVLKIHHSLCPHDCGYRCMSQRLAFVWVLGIWTQVFMLNTCMWPTELLSSNLFLYFWYWPLLPVFYSWVFLVRGYEFPWCQRASVGMMLFLAILLLSFGLVGFNSLLFIDVKAYLIGLKSYFPSIAALKSLVSPVLRESCCSVFLFVCCFFLDRGSLALNMTMACSFWLCLLNNERTGVCYHVGS